MAAQLPVFGALLDAFKASDLRNKILFTLGMLVVFRFLALDLAPGLGVEPNFDPGHDRRLRQMVGRPGVERGVGVPAGSALMLGGAGRFESVGDVFALADADADVVPLTEEAEAPRREEG